MKFLKFVLVSIWAFVTIVFLGVAVMAMAGQIYNMINSILI